MARQRHTPKGRLLITGTVLLILLVAGILTAGRTINGVAVQMSGRIVRHISEYHYRLLQVEFERSEGVLDASVQFMRERSAPTAFTWRRAGPNDASPCPMPRSRSGW